jgi:hypothetical protein
MARVSGSAAGRRERAPGLIEARTLSIVRAVGVGFDAGAGSPCAPPIRAAPPGNPLRHLAGHEASARRPYWRAMITALEYRN